MSETVILPVPDDETYRQLRELGHLVVMELEFNTDTQVYEAAIRTAGWKDT